MAKPLSATEKQLVRLVDDLSFHYTLDPYGFVMYAFPWGQGELEGEEGPDTWQKEFLVNLSKRMRASAGFGGVIREAVASGHGVGKAQGLDDTVDTPAGPRRWGDLQPGDVLFGLDGFPTRIVATTHFNPVPMYRVTFDDGSFLDVSSGHMWTVRGRQERRKNLESWRTLSTLDLLELGVKRPNGSSHARQWEIPVQGPARFEEREIDLHPYVVGLWLGDGTKGQPSWCKPYPEIKERVESFGYEVHTAGDGKQQRICNSTHLFSDPVFALGSSERYIPDSYKFNTVENRMELFRGLCDTDGEANSSGSIGYSTTSLRLAEDVLWLARSLGCKATLQEAIKDGWYPDSGGKRVECRQCYRLTINAPFNPFTIPHRKAAYKISEERYLKRWIDSIEPIGESEAMCVTVSNPDGLYQAGNFIVTHNTALVCWLILWAISTHRDTLGVVTANTENQLKTKTWAQLAKWHRLCIAKPLFELGATAIYSSVKAYEKTWCINMSPWSEENTEAFAGLHNKKKRLLVIYDEASAISDLIWEVTEGALTDLETEIIWCVFGNPTRNTGRFKECFEGGQFSNRWSTRRVDSRTSKFSNKEQLQEWATDYGEDSDFFKVRVKGEFPSASANQFISITDARSSLDRVLREEQFNFAPKILTCDPAWTGDDDLVIGLRQGLAFRILRVMPKNDNDIEVATILANLEDNERADAVFIDQGYGTGIYSAGKTWGRSWQLVNFAAASPDLGCANMRAYIWKQMRDWLKAGGSILKDSKLCAELTAPETVPRVDGKIQIESKEDMKRRKLRSPNRADALAISFAYPVSGRRNGRGIQFPGMKEQERTDNSSPQYGYAAQQTERQRFRDVMWRK